MLTQTTITAIKVLIYVAGHGQDSPIPMRVIAKELDAPQPYMAKINTDLARAGILRSHRGPSGGIQLGRPAESINLLEIIETCQGKFHDNYCLGEISNGYPLCSFHSAIHTATDEFVNALKKWSLADMVSGQCDLGPEHAKNKCVLVGLVPKS